MTLKPTALITQASSPLGLAFAELLAEQGHPLVLVARNTENLHHSAWVLQNRHHIHVDVITHELSTQGAGESLAAKIHARGHRIGVLINNAGMATYGPFAGGELDQQMAMLDLNVRTLTEITHQLLPGMLNAKQGWVLNIASSAVFQTGTQMVVYHASQMYVVHFSEALHQETQNHGVRVLALCPGPLGARRTKSHDNMEFPTVQEVAAHGLRLLFSDTDTTQASAVWTLSEDELKVQVG